MKALMAAAFPPAVPVPGALAEAAAEMEAEEADRCCFSAFRGRL